MVRKMPTYLPKCSLTVTEGQTYFILNFYVSIGLIDGLRLLIPTVLMANNEL